MTRDTLIKCLKNPNMGFTDCINIIRDYCIERGKKSEDTDKFIQLLSKNPILTLETANIAISYYEKKFSICKVLRISDNKVLLIY